MNKVVKSGVNYKCRVGVSIGTPIALYGSYAIEFVLGNNSHRIIRRSLSTL